MCGAWVDCYYFVVSICVGRKIALPIGIIIRVSCTGAAVSLELWNAKPHVTHASDGL